ncbi:MAG TPA: MBL fold metallo-hydrolase [Candidatus Limnocylindrales bacterium]
MELHFLGAATTVTGSQYLLVTERARVLIDCGMFQGGPNEGIRNRVPLAYDPHDVDAILLTHAHLDHCGLIPHVVAEGFSGPIYATAGTCELAQLVLLDSGKLQQEFVKRESRWERRHPERAAQEDREEQEHFEAAVGLAEAGASVPIVLEEDPRVAVPVAGLAPAVAARAPRPALVEPAPGADAGAGATAAGAGVTDARLRADLPHAASSGHPDVDAEAELRRQPPELEVDLDEPLYTVDEARRSLDQFRPVEYDQEIDVAPGVSATFVDAGHILGSAIIRLSVSEGDGATPTRIVFSGDLGRPNTPIIRDPTVVTDADYLLVESTYGGREHEPQQEAIATLTQIVRLVDESKGVLLVPSFAIGRTQELVWALDRLIDIGAIPLLPLYLDSPMATKATGIYRRHAEYFDAETRKLLDIGATPLDYPKQTVTSDIRQSQAIARAPRPYMIIASNGMLTGGRVLGHLRDLIDDPAAVLLFVGYQGQGTLGAHLQAGATKVRIDGQDRDVRCQVRSISGFSAHADESELLAWIGNFTNGKKAGDPGWPKQVFIVHGDPDAQAAIEPKINALGLETTIPAWRQSVTLE